MLPATGRQHRGCIIPQAVTHSLVLLKMSKIIARNMVELTGIINKPLLLHLVGCLYYLYFIIFFWDLLNIPNLPPILKTWRIWWALNNACKGRWDLIRHLKVKHILRTQLILPTYVVRFSRNRMTASLIGNSIFWGLNNEFVHIIYLTLSIFESEIL